MSNINRTILEGHLGGDIEVRYTPNGKAVADVNLAVRDGWGDNERTIWIGLTIWDKQAEAAAKYLSKGSKIFIEGRLTQDEWEDKETGKKRTKTRVTVEKWSFGDGKPSGASGQPKTQQARQEPAQAQSGVAQEDDDGGIPF